KRDGCVQSFHVTCPLANRVVNGDELATIGKCGFDLDVVDHLGDSIHDVLAREHMRTSLHKCGNAFSVACALQNKIGDKRHSLGVIEFDSAIKAAARHHRGHGNQ